MAVPQDRPSAFTCAQAAGVRSWHLTRFPDSNAAMHVRGRLGGKRAVQGRAQRSGNPTDEERGPRRGHARAPSKRRNSGAHQRRVCKRTNSSERGEKRDTARDCDERRCSQLGRVRALHRRTSRSDHQCRRDEARHRRARAAAFSALHAQHPPPGRGALAVCALQARSRQRFWSVRECDELATWHRARANPWLQKGTSRRNANASDSGRPSYRRATSHEPRTRGRPHLTPSAPSRRR